MVKSSISTDLTVVGDVSVVAVPAALAGELVYNVLPDGVAVGHQPELGRDRVLGGAVVLALRISL